MVTRRGKPWDMAVSEDRSCHVRFRFESARLQIGNNETGHFQRWADAGAGRARDAIFSEILIWILRHGARRAAATATGSDSATMTSSSSNPPSQHRLVGREGCGVRTARVTNWTSLQVGKQSALGAIATQESPLGKAFFKKLFIRIKPA
jgi:hypothetical protein